MNLAAVVERFTRSTADASQSGVLLADADRTGAAGLAEVRQ
jgi:hypothetical protein